MNVYHEVEPDSVGAILQNGLKCTSRGNKGSDTAIIKADQYLDERCPRELKDVGVSRDDNVYAYYVNDGLLIDITDGDSIALTEFVQKSEQKVLEVSVDSSRCFVSDLDTYDALKAAIESHEPQDVTDTLAKSFWQKLTRLSEYDGQSIRRPEIMITYDVEPVNLTQLN